MSINFRRKTIVLFICSLAFFVANLDVTIVNVALPSIANTYGVTILKTKNLLILFSFFYGVSIPLGSFMADKFGVKRILSYATIGFGITSLGCAFSNTLFMLDIMRSLQGISAAFFTPVARSIVIRNSDKTTIVNNMANVLSIGLLAQTMGPFIGGLIISHLNWRWVFFINVPICILIIFLSSAYLKNIIENLSMRFDWFSFINITLSLAGFLFLCEYVTQRINFAVLICVIFIVIISAYLFYKYSRKVPVNIINTTLLKDKIFRSSVVVGIITRQGVGAMSFIFVIVLSLVYGYKGEMIGNILLFYGLGVWISKILIPKLNKAYKIQALINYSGALLFFSTLGLAALVLYKSVFLFIILLLINGLSVSLYFGYLSGLTMQRVHRNESMQGSTILSLMIYICQSSAISIFSLIYMLFSAFTHLNNFKLFFSLLTLDLLILGAIMLFRSSKEIENYDVNTPFIRN